MSTDNITTVSLDKYSYGGESFGRLEDKRAVFVPFTLPGERVRIRLVEQKKGFARGALIEVLDSAPGRIEPRCPHFTSCGGCHYQHLPYEIQLEAKTNILCDTLTRIGKIIDPPVQPIIPSPTPWNYRNHVQFHISPQGTFGFQAPRSHEIIPIQECHLPVDPINEIWPMLDMEPVPGLARISLRAGSEGDILVILESSDPEPLELMVDLPVSVVHTGPGGSLVLAGDDHIVIRIADRDFRVSAGSFFQVNTRMTGLMIEHVLEMLSIPKGASLVDSYCGVGLFSAALAPHVERLVGIETSPISCEDFSLNLDEFDNVELYEAQVGQVLPALEFKPEIVILDPPRSGLDRSTMDGLLTMRPETIVYISCDPATLSRDALRLTAGGYQLSKVTPFDLFPQTFHIESISFWAK